jgi:UDP-N-acetylmuramoyl-L-alanyl-D-glutamate--2,6-diaminopimelate ligase
MILAELAASYPEARIEGDAAVAVVDLAYDSRSVVPGSLFFAVPGAVHDGLAFVADAVGRGATAIVSERPAQAGVPVVLVPSVRASMGVLASAFFGDPSRAVTLVGVTGTNGKTTTTFMLERCFLAAGMIPGLIGTVETHIGSERLPAVRTTPESIDLQRLFARMRDAGVRAVAMEVSSHGLALGRVDGTTYACSTFTNLTQDHLDFHGSMEDYFLAKASLFAPRLSQRAAVNIGDAYGRRLADRCTIPLVTYAIDETSAIVRATSMSLGRTGTDVRVATPQGQIDLRVPLAGRFNVANALAAIATCVALELPLDAAASGLAALPGVPGRLESIDAGQPYTVLVDYAHTPDSLAGLLRTAREICEGKLVVVFGCGGDRDRGKRPQMGRIGASFADRAVITSDNPRSEDPLAIIRQIEAGARETGMRYEIEPDRRLAIRRAVEGAAAGDVIVIAGKGHETGQQFADRTLPFDDRAVAREEIERCAR